MTRWREVALIAAGVWGAFTYSNFFIDVLLPGKDDWGIVVSELEKPGYQHAVILRTTDVICCLLVLSLLPWVHAALPPGKWRTCAIWSTAIFAIGNAVAGAVPLPEDEGLWPGVQQWVHDGASTISQTAIFIGAVAIAMDTHHHGRRWLHDAAWATFWIGGVVGTIAFGATAYVNSDSWQTGAAQRFQLTVTSLWIVCLGIFAAIDGVPARDRAKARVNASYADG